MVTKQIEEDDLGEEWVYLKNPIMDYEQETANAFCSFILKFYWRKRNNCPNELLMVLYNSGEKKHYKYLDVAKSVYTEMCDRAYNPGDYDMKFGAWYNRDISDQFEYERFE